MLSERTPSSIESNGLSNRPLNCILSLPDDLLCLILSTISRIEPPYGIRHYMHDIGMPRRRRSVALGVLRLSEVCKRFRALLLSMPTIWATVVFYLPKDAAKLALSRTGSALLTAHIPTDDECLMRTTHNMFASDRKQLVASIAKHVARLRSISAKQLEADECRHLFGRRALLLESIDFNFGSEYSERTPADLETIFIDAPNVQHVRLNCAFESHLIIGRTVKAGISFKLPSLRSLDISMFRGNIRIAHEMNFFTDIFEHSPLIDTLKLVFSHPDNGANWDTIFTGRDVRLAHLRSLDLTGSSFMDLPGLYARICRTRPSRCIITNHYSYHAREGMLQFVEAFAPKLHDPSYDGLLVHIDGDNSYPKLRIGAFPSLHNIGRYSSTSLQALPSVTLLSMHMADSLGSPTRQQVLDALIVVLKHNSIRQLIVDPPGLAAWTSVLQSIAPMCATVRELFVQYTWHVGESGHPSFPLLGPLPNLELLVLKPVTARGYTRGLHPWRKELIAWLESRKHAAPRIRRLHILGVKYYLPVSKANDDEADEMVRTRAAELIEELLDDRDEWIW